MTMLSVSTRLPWLTAFLGADARRSAREAARLYARLGRLAWSAAPGLVSLLGLLHLSLALVPAVQVWVYKLLVDGVAHPGALERREIWSAVALYGAMLLFSQAATALQGPLDDHLTERLQGRMRHMLLEVGERQAGLAFYDDEAVQNDLEAARTSMSYALGAALWVLPETVQKLAVIVTLSLLLGRLQSLLPLLLIVTAVPGIRYESRLSHYVWSGLLNRGPLWRWMGYCGRVLFSTEYAKEVRLFGLGGFFLDRYRETFERCHKETAMIRQREQRGTTLFGLANACVTGGAYVLIVLAAAHGRLSIGDVALYTGATLQLSVALSLVARHQVNLNEDLLKLRTFYSVLDRPPVLHTATQSMDGNRGSAALERRRLGRIPAAQAPHSRQSRDLLRVRQSTASDRSDSPTSRASASSVESRRAPRTAHRAREGSEHPAPEIALCGVSFTYPGRAAPALRRINLRIAPGEKIALVGENGAGKTTLLNLIARLYDPTEGAVLADGVPLPALDVRAWRRQLSNVSQEFLRLEAPLRANLAVGDLRREADDAALWAACEQVGVAEVVRALPGGLEQQLGKRFRGGVELSGGEWQKLAIARARLREEAGILLLDEPTSALDAPTEHAIFRQFVQLAEHRTTILVSHRFSTVHIAERIIVLEAGTIIEEGSHAALMARGGKYAELFELQAARYR